MSKRIIIIIKVTLTPVGCVACHEALMRRQVCNFRIQ